MDTTQWLYIIFFGVPIIFVLLAITHTYLVRKPAEKEQYLSDTAKDSTIGNASLIELVSEASAFEADKSSVKDTDGVNNVNDDSDSKIEAIKRYVQETIPVNRFPQINNAIEFSTTSQIVDIHIHPDETKAQAATEIVDVPNGVTIKVTRIRTVEHTIRIEWSATLLVKGNVGIKQLVSASIEGEIQRIKGYTSQQTESVEYEVTLNGEKHNHYKLVWMDIWLKGTANIQENAVSYSQPFQFRDRTELKVVPFIDS